MLTKFCITITYCDVAENHERMQKIGVARDSSFTYQHLRQLASENKNAEFIDLTTQEGGEACVLVFRNFIENHKDVADELLELDWDTKAKMRGKVVNKRARHNLCFADMNQEPDYEQGKGRVVAFNELPLLNEVKNRLEILTEEYDLVAEGNLYYDVSKCGIGYHGDAERNIVIGLRLGCTMDLCFRWYCRSEIVSETTTITLNPGDVYIMSTKATGNDWKKRIIHTLRHAAGCDKYTK